MKTYFLWAILWLTFTTNLWSQSNTQTGFNGSFQFSSFANGGTSDIRGTIDNFLDQTNQYFANQIAVNDIAWDNSGRRYKVMSVISSNLVQAVVDLQRIGGGTHIPFGLGFVSRETSTGLSLIPSVNNLGLSNQLESRVHNHNFKMIETAVNESNSSTINYSRLGQPVKDSFLIHAASVNYISNLTSAFTGQRLKLRTSGAEYIVANDSIVGYPVDGKAVIKITSLNKYAQVQPSEIGYNVQDFGAIPDDGISDDIAIQSCIDFCILNSTGVQNSVIIVPPGVYTLTNGVVIKKISGGAYTFVAITIKGTGVSPYAATQSLGRQAVFDVLNADGFGIGLVKGRNVTISNIAFLGHAPMGSNLSQSNVYNWTDAQWTGSGTYRNNPYSPYAGIVIDFPSNTVDADSYPDFTSYYGAAATAGGTSMININDCAFFYFMTGIAHSISKNLQNGDNLKVKNIYAQGNKSLFAVGQDQTRTGSIDNVYALFNEVILDCQRYGRQIGTPPVLSNFNIAGATRCVIRINSDNRAAFSMSDSYGESVYQLIVGDAFPTTFSSCAFDFQFLYRQPDCHIISNANFSNCTLKFYGGETNHALFVDGDCSFMQSMIGASGVYRFYSNAGGETTDRVSFYDCRYINADRGATYISQGKVRSNQLIYPGAANNFMDVLGYPVNGNIVHSVYGSSIVVWDQPLYDIASYGNVDIKVTPTKVYFISSTIATKTAVNDVFTTGIKFPANSSIILPSLKLTNLGNVSLVKGDTVFFEYTSVPSIIKDTTTYVVAMLKPSSNLPLIGSGTSGQNYILNKTPHTFAGLLRPKGTGIPIGTYVTRISTSTDTLFLSTNLTASFTNKYIYFFGSKKTANDRTSNDVIFNIGDEVNENGIRYICTSPGLNGSTVLPIFLPMLPNVSDGQIAFSITGALSGVSNFTFDNTNKISVLNGINSNSGYKVNGLAGSKMFWAQNSSLANNYTYLTEDGLYFSRTSDGAFFNGIRRDNASSLAGQGSVTIEYNAARHYFNYSNGGTLLATIMPNTLPVAWTGSGIFAVERIHTQYLNVPSNQTLSIISDDANGVGTQGVKIERTNRVGSGNAGIMAWVYDGTEVGRFTTAGNFAVGTATASAKLHVVGDCIVTSTIWHNSAKTVGDFIGTGSPESVVSASPGSTFRNTSGGATLSFYIKETGTGNTGWIAK